MSSALFLATLLATTALSAPIPLNTAANLDFDLDQAMLGRGLASLQSASVSPLTTSIGSASAHTSASSLPTAVTPVLTIANLDVDADPVYVVLSAPSDTAALPTPTALDDPAVTVSLLTLTGVTGAQPTPTPAPELVMVFEDPLEALAALRAEEALLASASALSSALPSASGTDVTPSVSTSIPTSIPSAASDASSTAIDSPSTVLPSASVSAPALSLVGMEMDVLPHSAAATAVPSASSGAPSINSVIASISSVSPLPTSTASAAPNYYIDTDGALVAETAIISSVASVAAAAAISSVALALPSGIELPPLLKGFAL